MKNFFIAFCISSLINFSYGDEIFSGSRMLKDSYSPLSNEVPRYVLISGVGLSILFATTKKSVGDPFRNNLRKNSTLKSLKALASIGGSGLMNGGYVLGMLGDYFYSNSRKNLANATLMSEATFFSAAIAYTLKETTNEPRPDKPAEMDSFPSGSSTLAFSFASYVGARHSLWWGAGAYALASITALSRLNQNRHHFHDVTAGATLGAVYGLGVYFQNFKKKSNPSKAETESTVPLFFAWIDEGGFKFRVDSIF